MPFSIVIGLAEMVAQRTPSLRRNERSYDDMSGQERGEKAGSLTWIGGVPGGDPLGAGIMRCLPSQKHRATSESHMPGKRTRGEGRPREKAGPHFRQRRSGGPISTRKGSDR